MGIHKNTQCVSVTPIRMHLTSSRLSAIARGDGFSCVPQVIQDAVSPASVMLVVVKILVIWGLYTLWHNHIQFMESELVQVSVYSSR